MAWVLSLPVYLIIIFPSCLGGYAEDSLLTRARCYGHLGQKKTAIFDFNAILKEDPGNAQALSGRGFIYLALNQQKVLLLS